MRALLVDDFLARLEIAHGRAFGAGGTVSSAVA
jgi:hypothetical protein